MRIMIFGISSFLGKKLLSILTRDNNYIIGTYCNNNTKRSNDIKVNLLEYDKIIDLLENYCPDVIIYCAALSSIQECEKNKNTAMMLNSVTPINIAMWCEENKKTIVYISSECVYDGNQDFYFETSQCIPVNFYGTTKLISEIAIKNIFKNFIIVRLPLLYGYNDPSDKDTIVKVILNSLLENKSISLDNSRIKYPILIDDVANAIKYLIYNRRYGIYNFSSEKPLSKYDMGIIIAEYLGKNKCLIKSSNSEIARIQPFKVNMRSIVLIINLWNLKKVLSLCTKNI